MVKNLTPTPRLKAGIFVRALIRRVQVEGASAFVVRSGAEEAGAIILKLSKLDGTEPGAEPGPQCQGRTGLVTAAG